MTTYSTGTISVGAGSTSVTGSGTNWATAGLRAGDQFEAAGLSVRIASINSATSITLARAWPGSTLSGANYDIWLIPDDERALTQVNLLLQALGSDTITSLGGLTSAANLMPYWTGPGVMATTALTPAARTLLDDADVAAMRTTLGVGVAHADGTAGAPALAFAADPNTGIFRPTTDALAIATAGAERLTITSSGNVGIGTTTPASRLDVNGDVTVLDKIIHSGDTNTAIRFPAADTFTVETNGVERLRVGSTGRVGIGTTIPQRPLVVSNAGAEGIEFQAGESAGVNKTVHYNRATSQYTDSLTLANNHIFSKGPAEVARIDPSGNVCVGTSTPIAAATNTVQGVTLAANYTWFAKNDTNYIQRPNDTDGGAFAFYRGTVNVGSITMSSGATAYNTTSDRRLKSNITPAPDAGYLIDGIQIVSHDWNAGGARVEHGVIAQDLHRVVPAAVTPGDDGDAVEKPWAVDYSKLVPLLVKEIQDLRARVAALEGGAP